MAPETLDLVRSALSEDELRTARDIAEYTELSIATVYNALSVLNAVRLHIGKNHFAYITGDESSPVTIDTPGTIDGLSWAEYTAYAIDYVSKVHLKGEPTVDSYATGFQDIANTFQTIANHVKAVQDRPDWRIVLGLDTDTENE